MNTDRPAEFDVFLTRDVEQLNELLRTEFWQAMDGPDKHRHFHYAKDYNER